jgi:ABC-2 type transport system ATP-binding protein
MATLAVQAEQLVKRFGDLEAVGGVSFEVPEGSVLGMLGPNGAGKTTTVRMLTTLLRPDGGTARVHGIDVRHDPQRVRSIIGLAGQYAAIDENLTGKENLALVGRLTHLSARDIDARAAELLGQFGLAHAGDRVARTYSGGMRRRLDLAAALVHRPPVLFLDEPTTGLDPKGRNDLWVVIQDLVRGGTTVLLTTQYLEEADVLADSIVVIDQGKVIAEGTSAQLKERLGDTVIEIVMRDDADAVAAEGALGPVGGAQRDGLLVRVSVAGGSGPRAMLAAVRILGDRDLDPVTMVLREPTLDDVFLELTGHAAVQDDEDLEEEAS